MTPTTKESVEIARALVSEYLHGEHASLREAIALRFDAAIAGAVKERDELLAECEKVISGMIPVGEYAARRDAVMRALREREGR